MAIKKGAQKPASSAVKGRATLADILNKPRDETEPSMAAPVQDEKMTQFNVRLPVGLAKQVKLRAVQEDKNPKDVVIEALRAWFSGTAS
jgi:hypothetical protein